MRPQARAACATACVLAVLLPGSSRVLILVTQPAGMTDGAFYTTVSAIEPVLDTLLPAWVTWDWYRQAHLGANGFYLDGDPVSSGTLVNLDNEALT